MKKKIVGLLIIILLLSCVALAKESPKPILKTGDVKNFIKTFPLISKELKEYGVKYERKSGNIAFPEALKASSDFHKILNKYGWDKGFYIKMSTIFTGYVALVYSEEFQKAESEIKKSIKEMESNPNIPEAMKKQLKDQFKASYGVMLNSGKELKKNIHENDLKLIQVNQEDLKKLFDETK
jgi:hypothetical protein